MRRAALLLLTVLVVGACGPDPATGSVAVPASTAPAAVVTAAPGQAPEALRFTAPLVGGGMLDASTLADKPTVFWFWAPG
jgi:hypothetical protein